MTHRLGSYSSEMINRLLEQNDSVVASSMRLQLAHCWEKSADISEFPYSPSPTRTADSAHNS